MRSEISPTARAAQGKASASSSLILRSRSLENASIGAKPIKMAMPQLLAYRRPLLSQKGFFSKYPTTIASIAATAKPQTVPNDITMVAIPEKSKRRKTKKVSLMVIVLAHSSFWRLLWNAPINL